MVLIAFVTFGDLVLFYWLIIFAFILAALASAL